MQKLSQIHLAFLNGTEASLHAIRTNIELTRHLDHFPRLTLRPVTHDADLLIFRRILPRGRIPLCLPGGLLRLLLYPVLLFRHIIYNPLFLGLADGGPADFHSWWAAVRRHGGLHRVYSKTPPKTSKNPINGPPFSPSSAKCGWKAGHIDGCPPGWCGSSGPAPPVGFGAKGTHCVVNLAWTQAFGIIAK